MSFGKRPGNGSKPDRARRPSEWSEEYESGAPAGPSAVDIWHSLATWQRQLLSFAGILLAITVVGGGLQSMILGHARNIEAASSRPWKDPHSFQLELPVHDVVPVVAQHNMKLREACVESLEPFYRQVRLRNYEPKMHLVSGKINVNLDQSGPFLTCLFSNEVKRFCIPSERAIAIGMLEKYVAVLRAYAAAEKKSGNSPAAEFEAIRHDLTDKDKTPSDIVAAPPERYGYFDTGVARAIQNLSHSGYLERRHLSKSLLAEIGPYLDKPQMEPCAP